MASTEPERREEEQKEAASAGDGGVVEDEDTGAQIAPIVTLSEVAVTTGEEDENALLDLKAKLYRFDKESNQWKERGTGNVKLLKHRETGKVRLVMRQAKTLKICANHRVVPAIKVQEHAGNDKSCLWHAADFADGELREEMFCIRFGSVESCRKFMEMIEGIAESLGRNEEKESEDSTEVAGLVEKLSVNGSNTEKGNNPAAAAADKTEDEKLETKIKTEDFTWA